MAFNFLFTIASCLSLLLTVNVASAQDSKDLSSFMISRQELIDKSDKGFIVVDVRHESEFRKFRINGSLNIPAHELKNKLFLKKKALVLVNGNNHHILLKVAENLTSIDFVSVKVLRGGLKGWKDSGGSLEGDFFAQQKLDELSPKEFQILKEFGKWHIFEISGNLEDSALFFNSVIKVHKSQNINGLIKKIELLKSEDGQGTDRYLLVMTSDGREHGKIRKRLKLKNLGNIFFMRGGCSVYNSFLKNQLLMQHPGEKKVEKCSCCPQ